MILTIRSLGDLVGWKDRSPIIRLMDRYLLFMLLLVKPSRRYLGMQGHLRISAL